MEMNQPSQSHILSLPMVLDQGSYDLKMAAFFSDGDAISSGVYSFAADASAAVLTLEPASSAVRSVLTEIYQTVMEIADVTPNGAQASVDTTGESIETINVILIEGSRIPINQTCAHE